MTAVVRGAASVCALVALLLLLAGVTSAAYAEDIVLQDATTASYPKVSLDVVISAGLVPANGKPDFSVVENGIAVKDLKVASAAENRRPKDVVLLIDTSGSMEGPPLANAKSAANTFVDAMGANDRVAVVGFSSEPHAVVDFTSDPAALDAGIASLATKGHTALYDGLIQASRLFKDAGRDRYIVVLSDGNDTTSINKLDAAVQAITNAGIPLYAVVLSSPDYNPAALKTLAKQSGGKLIAAGKAEKLTAVFQDIAEELRNVYTVSFVSAKPSTKDLEVQLAVSNGQAAGSLTTAIANPIYAKGVLATAGIAAPSGGSLPVELGTALLFGLAVAALIYALALMLGPKDNALRQLDYYGEAASSGGQSGPVASSRSRVLNAVSSVVERGGFTGMVRSSLERAALPLRPNEYIFLHLLVTATAGFAAQLVLRNLALSSLVVIVFVALPILLISMKIDHRRRAFEDQLPDVLSLLAGSLRAGWGIQQAIELVVEEIAEPAASEFARVQSEARFGLPLEQALDRMAERLDSDDFRWTVTAISIQREVGGNLAEVLDVVATSIRRRAELRRQVSALTAESRFSMIVLTILPFFLLGALFVVNPEYASVLIENQLGVIALAVGFVLLLIGIVWINRLTKIEV